jgi:hypothetical protein
MNHKAKEILRQHVQTLLQSLEEGVLSAELLGGDAGAAEEGGDISPAALLSLVLGDDGLLDAFESRLERRFQALGERLIGQMDDIMCEHVEKYMTELLGGSGEAESLAFATSGDSLLTSVAQAGVLGQSFSQTLEGAVASSATGLVNALFSRTKTRRNESERSKASSQRFRQSRGQQQAELAEQISRGRRYQ